MKLSQFVFKEGLLLPSKEGLHCSKALNGVPSARENRRDECTQSCSKQVCGLHGGVRVLELKYVFVKLKSIFKKTIWCTPRHFEN